MPENGSRLQYTGQLLPQRTWSQRAMMSPGKSPLLFSFPEVDGDLSSDMSHSTLGYPGLKEAQIYIRFRLRLDMEDWNQTMWYGRVACLRWWQSRTSFHRQKGEGPQTPLPVQTGALEGNAWALTV